MTKASARKLTLTSTIGMSEPSTSWWTCITEALQNLQCITSCCTAPHTHKRLRQVCLNLLQTSTQSLLHVRNKTCHHTSWCTSITEALQNLQCITSCCTLPHTRDVQTLVRSAFRIMRKRCHTCACANITLVLVQMSHLCWCKCHVSIQCDLPCCRG